MARKAISYARVSTDDQAEHLKTIEELEKFANRAFEHSIPDERKPDLIRELDVKLEPAWDGQEMWAHVTCIVGREYMPLIETPIEFVV